MTDERTTDERTTDERKPAPRPAPRGEHEPTHVYGARTLMYILQYEYVYGYLTDDDLELAHYAAGAALSRRTMIGDETTPARAYDAIEETRRMITRVLTRRRADAAAAVVPLPSAAVDDKPNEGPMAPLAPRPIVQPPAPARVLAPVDIRF